MSSRRHPLTYWRTRLEAQIDLDQLMQGCCQALMELSGADRCSIMVLDHNGEELAVRWAQGVRVAPPATPQRRMTFRVGEGLCGWVARAQKPLCSFKVDQETRFVPHQQPTPGFRPVKGLCCLPLVANGRTVGVANLSTFSSTRRFCWTRRPEAQRFLDQLSQVIAQATVLREAELVSSRWHRLAKATAETVTHVSHEVRTPLTLITESAQQLLDGLAGPLAPSQKQLVTIVRSQARRMLTLANELLDLSKIEAGRLAIARAPLDLAEVVREVAGHYEPLIAPRRLVVQCPPAPPVYGDRARLTQVVENLLTNAIKYTPPTGTITLTLQAPSRQVELRVSDTGRGIPKRDQRHIFEKFYQVKAPIHAAVHGTGMGLTIVKEIVQLHGGTIRVVSTPGHGTTFIVRLPAFHPELALVEEFHAMRDRAARDGASVGCQVFLAAPGTVVEWTKVIEVLRQHVAREDRVLPHEGGELVALLSVSDPEGFRAMRRRLEGVLAVHPELFPGGRMRWGWALVPQEATELTAALKLAEQRARG